MADRWGRDPGVKELVEYYDQPEHSAWHLLTGKEAGLLYEEIKRCLDERSGFPYIARNFYRLTTKEGVDAYLQFKDTQEMLYETIQTVKRSPRGLRRGVRILIIKGRQLFISSFVEAYIAWLTQTNPNNRGLVVSYNEPHAADLFRIILHIYDQLPWWLRPMIGSRKYEEGIHLINPDPELRRLEPGLNSSIVVQGATQNVGVAEGITVNSAHLSEFGSWDPTKARKVIMGDFRWALPDAPNTFAVLETRVRQASKFAERLWESQVELGDDADWYPFFVPIYFDKSHFVAPQAGWKPDKPEIAVKERAAEEWCICSSCRQVRPATFGGEALVGVACKNCGKGSYAPYVLQEGQMRWLEERRKNAEYMGEAAVMEMQQSLATNPQEAFAHVTETVFSRQARDWVAATTRGECLARGYMSEDGVFHAPRRQYDEESAQCWAAGCKDNHTGETDRYLKIWQPPQRGCKYGMGVDVSAGYGGSNDFSVIIVNKISQMPNPDIQVAQYRCNTISAWHLTDLANSIGRWYNNALAVVDYTNYQTVGDRLVNFFHYPNIYRWFQADAIQQQSNRVHWVWNSKNKESAWQVLDGWLRDHSYIIKDPVLAKEIRHFQRLDDGSLGAPDSKDEDGLGDDFEKVHDDCVMAAISLIVASHQQDPRREHDTGVPQSNGVRGPGEWIGTCRKCERSFDAKAPCERDKCPWCGSVWLSWKCSKEKAPPLAFDYYEMGQSGVSRDRGGKAEDFNFGYSSSDSGGFG